jgi:hypothetical protein
MTSRTRFCAPKPIAIRDARASQNQHDVDGQLTQHHQNCSKVTVTVTRLPRMPDSVLAAAATRDRLARDGG